MVQVNLDTALRLTFTRIVGLGVSSPSFPSLWDKSEEDGVLPGAEAEVLVTKNPGAGSKDPGSLLRPSPTP